MINVKYIWFVQTTEAHKYNSHIHDCYEINYYIHCNGTVEYFNNNNLKPSEINDTMGLTYLEDPKFKSNKDVLNFSDGTLIFMPPNVVHNEIRNIPGNNICIGFTTDNDDFDTNPKIIEDTTLELRKYIDDITKEYYKKAKHYHEYINALTYLLVCEIDRRGNEKESKYDPIIYAVNFIKNNISRDINLPQLAANSGYSIDHFRFLFKKQTGESPITYILSKRMSLACNLLISSTFNISKISNLCGYVDIAQFTAIFKKKIGMSPSEYRKKNREEN